jgi:diguanylate cyclase (GGDEF)-like protein/PAS domain S-box-containing protein
MGVNITPQEGSALYRLLAENTSDIILKTDCQGFILHASQAIERLGFVLPSMLIGPHILDLVHPSGADAVRSEHDAAIDGRPNGNWIEFPALTNDNSEHWFEIQVSRLTDEQDQVYGALSVMRSIDERRNFQDRLFTASMTDHLTGLANRKAFMTMLQDLVDEDADGCLALFDIDRFKTINMQHGPSVGDEVLVVFSDLLRTMIRSEDVVSRIGDETFAVLMKGATADQAEAVCRRIVSTLADIHKTSGPGSLAITASAGVARIGHSLHHTLKRAELALFFAKAKGRNRLEMDSAAPMPPAPGELSYRVA